MHQSISLSQFRDAFRDCGRGDQFSYQGLEVLFDCLEECSQDTGEECELDVIALCCEFEESDWQDIATDYNIDLADCTDDDERREAVLEYLHDRTLVCGETPHSIVYACF